MEREEKVIKIGGCGGGGKGEEEGGGGKGELGLNN